MKFPNDFDTLGRIAKVRDTICEVLMKKCDRDYTDPNEEFFDKLSSTSCGNRGVLSDFEGDIHFEPMDLNTGIENGIVIQSLGVDH